MQFLVIFLFSLAVFNASAFARSGSCFDLRVSGDQTHLFNQGEIVVFELARNGDTPASGVSVAVKIFRGFGLGLPLEASRSNKGERFAIFNIFNPVEWKLVSDTTAKRRLLATGVSQRVFKLDLSPESDEAITIDPGVYKLQFEMIPHSSLGGGSVDYGQFRCQGRAEITIGVVANPSQQE